MYSDVGHAWVGEDESKRICRFMQDCWLTLSTCTLCSSCPWGWLTQLTVIEQPKAGELTMSTTMQEDVMMKDKRRRAEDEKKPAIDNTHHHTKLVSPELETQQAEQRVYSQKGCNESSRER